MKYKSEFQEQIDVLQFNDYELALRQRRMLGRASLEGIPIDIFVLSCPDYSSDRDKYTFSGGLGEGVPLLTKHHLIAIEPLIELCEKTDTKARVTVLVADIEAYNQALCDQYTGGSRDEYLKICRGSMKAIDDKFAHIYQSQGIDFCVSGFVDFFALDNEPEKFLTTRALYKEILYRAYSRPGTLRDKITNNIRSKVNGRYYASEYREDVLPDNDLLVDREITTMSEYLALGHLIDETSVQPIIVVHKGTNDHLFNERNQLLIPGDINTSKPAIPLLIRQKAVY